MKDNNLNTLIGGKIKKHRQSLRLSQKELGMKIGIDPNQAQQYISKYERGILKIPAEILVKISRLTRCPLSKLVP
jgi:transcriptional regulator with XRE-family HTH domain